MFLGLNLLSLVLAVLYSKRTSPDVKSYFSCFYLISMRLTLQKNYRSPAPKHKKSQNLLIASNNSTKTGINLY